MDERPITRSMKFTEEEIVTRQASILEAEKQLRADRAAFEKEQERSSLTLRTEYERIRELQARDPPQINRELEEIHAKIRALTDICTTAMSNLNNNNATPISEAETATFREEHFPSLRRTNFTSLKDALSTVPHFNGTDMSVFHFAETCERAREMLPRDMEHNLAQMITSKLKGHALQIIRDVNVKTIAELTDLLKAAFAPRKTINQYRGELGNIYQLPGESILTYTGRIKDLKAALLDCERQTRGDISREFMRETEQEILESFVNGLKSDIRLNLKIEGYRNFSDATIKAVQLAKTLEQERKRYTSRNDFPRRDAPTYEKPSHTPSYEKTRHTDTTDKPQPLNPRAQSYTPRPKPAGNPANDDLKVCKYCKGVGHEISECRKLAYKNAQTQPRYDTQRPDGANQPRVNFLEETVTDNDPPPESHRSN